jgi:hypothetical protein
MALDVTEVETLLSVDAGRVPPDTLVFTAADPEAPTRRVYAFLSGMTALGAVGCLLNGADRQIVLLVLLAAAILLVMAWPTAPEPEEERHKRATLVITPQAMIVRDDQGLRSWRFDELAGVHPFTHADGDGLLLVRRDGSRDFLDCLLFSRGERLRELIGGRLHPRVG